MVELGRLDEMINRFRWVVFVLFNGELEVLLEVVIKFCKEGRSIWKIYCFFIKNKNKWCIIYNVVDFYIYIKNYYFVIKNRWLFNVVYFVKKKILLFCFIE